jgi:hypothetical protein
MLTISFPELAQAQGFSLSQRNFDAVREFYEPPNKLSVALDNILRSHRQSAVEAETRYSLDFPQSQISPGELPSTRVFGICPN